MRNPLYNDDFENFLQEQAKDHRMYPSDHIWRNIQESIHGERKWPALSFISIIVISSLVVSTLLIKPHLQAENKIGQSSSSVSRTAKSESLKAAKTEEVLEQHLTANNISQKTIAEVSVAGDKSAYVKPQFVASENVSDKSSGSSAPAAKVNMQNQPNKLIATSAVKPQQQVSREVVKAEQARIIISPFPPVTPESFYSNTKEAKRVNNVSGLQLFYPVSFSDEDEIWRNFALTNASYLIKRNMPKLDFQFYVTPSVSYRRLIDKNTGNPVQSFVSAIPASAKYSIDVNGIVKHRPAIGSEVGFALGYHLYKRLTVKAGLQFNIRRYNIEAYSYNSPATSVALSDNNTPDTLNTYSLYRNYALSSTPITLTNSYYEISLPVGIDWQLLSSGRLGLNVAASVQPTYTFDKEPFVITSDYKNYADGSLLMRNWNLNTSFETYISYKIGAIRWQIGPQFRYQQMPTYSNKYPIREYLLDYGLKLGFSKTIGNK